MKPDINIVEVSPRDGLQNEKAIVPLPIKLEFIQLLLNSGLQTIEATSFVSPRWVPQMADHEEVMHYFSEKNVSARLPVLVPNQLGLENAIACHVKDIAVFAAASETFSQKNTHRSIAQSLDDYEELIGNAITANLRVRGYVSCALGCPYEGAVPIDQVVRVAQSLYQFGCEEVALGDTIGVGTPLLAKRVVSAVAQVIPIDKLAVHFHDTYGQAIANILACLDVGITTIDSSVAGLGGCPYAKGATGNVATEEVIYLLHGMGLKTGVDLDKLIEAGQYICQHLVKPNRSKVAVALLAKKGP